MTIHRVFLIFILQRVYFRTPKVFWYSNRIGPLTWALMISLQKPVFGKRNGPPVTPPSCLESGEDNRLLYTECTLSTLSWLFSRSTWKDTFQTRTTHIQFKETLRSASGSSRRWYSKYISLNKKIVYIFKTLFSWKILHSSAVPL